MPTVIAAATDAATPTAVDSGSDASRPTLTQAKPQAVASAGVSRPRLQTESEAAIATPATSTATPQVSAGQPKPVNPKSTSHAVMLAIVATVTQPR
ncbi:hypothetical protein DUY81_13590 [Acidipropionibacterium acidipropionici]|nr:hypothetical protein DUY81_13590 [Acidipropionibacterium acidipropionici]